MSLLRGRFNQIAFQAMNTHVVPRWAQVGPMNLAIRDIPNIPLFHVDVITYPCLNLYAGLATLIARFKGPIWGPSGTDRSQVGPMLAPCCSLGNLCLYKRPLVLKMMDL